MKRSMRAEHHAVNHDRAVLLRRPAPVYSSSKRSGSWKSSWMVPHCQVRPRRVGQMEVQLRAIEGAVALVDHIVLAQSR